MKKLFFIIVCFNIVLSANFIRDNAKKVILDTKTNLMWQDNSEAKTKLLKWTDAINYCESLTLGGYSNWRLPNIRELESIVDINNADPVIVDVFVNVSNNLYFSSTTNLTLGSDSALLVKFQYGDVLNAPKDNTYNIRCVRNY